MQLKEPEKNQFKIKGFSKDKEEEFIKKYTKALMFNTKRSSKFQKTAISTDFDIQFDQFTKIYFSKREVYSKAANSPLSGTSDFVQNANSSVDSPNSFSRNYSALLDVAFDSKIDIGYDFCINKISNSTLPNFRNKFSTLQAKKLEISARDQIAYFTKPMQTFTLPGVCSEYNQTSLDWSKTNFIGVIANKNIYLWDKSKNTVTSLYDDDSDDKVTQNPFSSLKFLKDGASIATSRVKGECEIWDIEKNVIKTNIKTQMDAKTNIISLNEIMPIISCGNKNGEIYNFDSRTGALVSRLKTESKSEILGLTWSADGLYLACSDVCGEINTWNSYSNNVLFKDKSHGDAIKALKFSPYQPNVLASGGGATDNSIKIWRVDRNRFEQLGTINTESQTTSIIWSKNNNNELLSTHGYPNNDISIWDLNTGTRKHEISAHNSRITNAVMGPDSETIVTSGADEILNFWKAFISPQSQNTRKRRIL